jgi:hypothetical protein
MIRLRLRFSKFQGQIIISSNMVIIKIMIRVYVKFSSASLNFKFKT